jgi:XTP/dITP diphosphohydrolase
MKTSLIFATNNPHKLEEVSQILGNSIEIRSLNDINCHADIPETASTLEGNARLKAQYIYDNYHADVFADDTGLEIEALGGEPGVYSARYAGEAKRSQDNVRKVLDKLKGETNRNAQFRTVIALIINGQINYFEGIVKGRIIEEGRGEAGFGYDPIFIPNGFTKTFAELGNEEKNKISHRARAVEEMKKFLCK